MQGELLDWYKSGTVFRCLENLNKNQMSNVSERSLLIASMFEISICEFRMTGRTHLSFTITFALRIGQ